MNDATPPVAVDGVAAPAVAWLPDSPSAPPPVVLLGHGGSGTKTSERHRRLGSRLTRHGIAALAVDGPFHGDRVEAPVPAPDYQRRMVRLGVEQVLAHMVHDWLAALDALGARVDSTRCAYLGLSLGARIGVPLAAALGESLRCAVFGKFGLRQSDQFLSGLATPALHREAAGRITAPTLVAARSDDELFPRQGVLDLYDALGSTDKTLVLRPGQHASNHPEEETEWLEFVRRHLTRSR